MINLNDLQFKSYIKKPIAIKACQLHEDFSVNTLEGLMTAEAGDYLIIGVKGELYPCAKEIFEETYEQVEDLNER